MGLDVALGVIILIAAIRGWLQGFVYQAIRIAGLVACIYLAAPVRDQAKPHVVAYLPTIPSEWVDRLLWWVSAALAYVVVVGVTSLAIKMTRRPEIPGIPGQSSRNDQFAGFLMGVAKGVLVAAFMTAGIQKYALTQMATVPWADQQVKTSQAIRWNEQYQPAAKIWLSPPVQHVVILVERMGLQGAGLPDEKPADQPVVQTASRPTDPEDVEGSKSRKGAPNASANPSPTAVPKLRIPNHGMEEMEKVVEEINATIDARRKASN
jgi:uncharacterized membrane protein required for colicin V production